MPDSPAPKTIALPSRIVIREFAVKLGLPVAQVMAELIKNGIMSSQNEEIDFETASIIAEDFGVHARRLEGAAAEEATPTFIIDEWIKKEDPKTLAPRPPVVVVLGHVDHGKTMLLDTIRKTKVIESEAGGITQHIGAYQAVHKQRPITFVDTPGHEAFSAMRSRGAKVADVAILVVAADDGVKPQTEEGIRILTETGLPFVVAMNKIDKPDANPEKVKKDLAARNILVEGYGGSIVAVPVSAKAGTNVDELLDQLLLVAEVEKGKLVANPKGALLGTIVESHVDSGEGPVATVLVHNGTLRRGDEVRAGAAFGKVKILKDSHGRLVETAPPSFPVRVLGLKGTPLVGDSLTIADDPKELRKQQKKVARTRPLNVAPKGGPEEARADAAVLNLVIKADRLGSLEAIRDAIEKLKHEEVRIVAVEQGLGNITEADVLRAETADALLLGFHVAVTPSAADVARGRDLPIKTYTVIYELLDDVKASAEKLLRPTVTETILGNLTVLAVFRTEAAAQIVGGRVEQGSMVLQAAVRVLRDSQNIGSGKIVELQHNKTAAKTVGAGQEAGLKVQGFSGIQIGDVLQAYERVEQRRHIGGPA